MTLIWAAQSVVVALAFGGLGVVTERLIRRSGRQARFAWVASIATTTLISVAAFLEIPLLPRPLASVLPLNAEALRLSQIMRWPQLVFLGGWIAGSGWLATRLLYSAWSLRKRVSDSDRVKRSHGFVYQDDDLGPSAAGVVDPVIVVPSWLSEADDAVRRMLIQHQREHARAADPAIIALGWAAVALFPWNLPLWWQFRRLRQAVEVDCDFRVIRATGDPRQYGRVLLEAARSSAPADGSLVNATVSGAFLGSRLRYLTDGIRPAPPLLQQLVNLVQAQLQRSDIARPPGHWWLRFTEFVYSRETFENIFQQTIADLRHEFNNALTKGRVWKARWIRLRGYLSIINTVVTHGVAKIIRQLVWIIHLIGKL